MCWTCEVCTRACMCASVVACRGTFTVSIVVFSAVAAGVKIGDDGATMLSRALETNTSLVSLSLFGAPVAACAVVCAYQRHRRCIESSLWSASLPSQTRKSARCPSSRWPQRLKSTRDLLIFQLLVWPLVLACFIECKPAKHRHERHACTCPQTTSSMTWAP